MARRLGSLRNRLLLLIVVVLAVNGATAAFLASRVITERFGQYVIYQQVASRQRRQTLQETLPPLLAAYYTQHQGWSQVERVLTGLGDMTDERVLLADASGRILIDSAGSLVGQGIPPAFADVGRAIRASTPAGSRVVGTLAVVAIEKAAGNSSEAAYIAQVNRALLWAVLGTGLFAVILILATSRPILKPVEALTAAARRMERGELQQRVRVDGGGEIGELARAFNAMADSLARAEQLRRNMVSDVAHELRTPLSNIRGYLEAVQDGVVVPSPAMIASLHEEAMLLSRLVSDLQELALVEAGQLRFFLQQVSLPAVVEKVVQAVHHPGNGDGPVIELAVPAGLPAVYADPERVGQILRNLLVNAVTHAPVDGTVRVAAHPENGHVVVDVTNTGDPIAEEHLPYLFERFYRADRSRNRSTGGSGLGLAIVKQLVEAQDGQVWARNVDPRRVQFSFSLPISSLREE